MTTTNPIGKQKMLGKEPILVCCCGEDLTPAHYQLTEGKCGPPVHATGCECDECVCRYNDSSLGKTINVAIAELLGHKVGHLIYGPNGDDDHEDYIAFVNPVSGDVMHGLRFRVGMPMIGRSPVPDYEKDDGVALEAARRFAENLGLGFALGFTSPRFLMAFSRYDQGMLTWSTTAESPKISTAIVRAIYNAAQELLP